MPGDCSFNLAWLRNDSYKEWLVQDKLLPGSGARCKVCLKSFDIRSMGESALKSHMNGKKHRELTKQLTTSVCVKDNTKLLCPVVTEAEVNSSGESSRSIPVNVTRGFVCSDCYQKWCSGSWVVVGNENVHFPLLPQIIWIVRPSFQENVPWQRYSVSIPVWRDEEFLYHQPWRCSAFQIVAVTESQMWTKRICSTVWRKYELEDAE